MLDKSQIIDFLKNNKEYLLHNYHILVLALYGSYARDEATEKSDIDIVYEKISTISYQSYLEAEQYLKSKLQKKVELVNIKYMNPVIKKSAEKDFIYV